MVIYEFFCSYQHVYAFIFREIHGYPPDNCASEKILFISPKVYQWLHTGTVHLLINYISKMSMY